MFVVNINRAVMAVFFFMMTHMTQAALPIDYDALSTTEKQDVLWQNILTSYNTEPRPEIVTGGFWHTLELLKGLFSLSPTFDYASDEMPKGRKKIIHANGSVGKMVFEPASGHPFTGIYQRGGRGLVRLSLAQASTDTSYIPGMAVKFFVDDHPSLNLHVMNALEGQGEDWNFFAKTFSNQIEHPTGWVLKAIEKIFEWTRSPANDLPVSHLAQWNEYGEPIAMPVAPTRLFFKPVESVSHIIPSDSREDFRQSLETIPLGPIYDVYGELAGRSYLIGTIHLESQLLASKYGDSTLFFQHQR